MQLALLFGSLAALGTVIASPLTLRQENDPAFALCKTSPIALKGALNEVCNVAFQGATCKSCDFQWAIYNACNCYTDDETCNQALSEATFCEASCFGKCGAARQTTVPKQDYTAPNSPASTADICKVANKGSNYKDCDMLIANCNICKCFGSLYFKDKAGQGDCTALCSFADMCNTSCEELGECQKHI